MCHALLRAPGTPSYIHPYAVVLLLHGCLHVEDVPVRITDVASAMPPGLRRQRLPPLDLKACALRVLLLHIRDCQRHQDTVMGGTSCQSTSVLGTRGLAPHGEGTGYRGQATA
jgi:hypothetical protein